MAAGARKLSAYVRRILRRPEVCVMSALILAISGNEYIQPPVYVSPQTLSPLVKGLATIEIAPSSC